jgi:quinol---cytochrome c reductase iron-sulfur subunit
VTPWRLALAAAVWLLGRARGRRHGARLRDESAAEPPPTRRELPGDRRAELVVAALLLAAGVLGVAFLVLYVVWDDTQILGLALGLGLACAAAALVVAGNQVVVQETAEEERPDLGEDTEARDEAVADLRRGTEGISRRRLLAGSAGVAAAGLGVAAAVPAASLGPNVADRIDATPWRRGRRVVDPAGHPILADDVTEGALVTGFPEGGDPRALSSPIVMVRLPASQLELPAGRDPARWAPEGIVAYSKICTHAGCAISLYRYPLYRPTEPAPALVCPCHYSTFDPARGAQRTFGPAGRALPQLPLEIDAATRELRAGGGFSGSIGPAWFSVRR